MNMPKPCGFYVLIKMPDQEEKSEGGIILPDDLTKKEQAACGIGEVIAFGPTCFQGWEGCKPSSSSNIRSHQLWGVEVGDTVEFRSFDGMKSIVSGGEQYRYIPDSNLIGVIE